MTTQNINPFLAVCNNCMDFNKENNTCEIRYKVASDKSKSPLPRKPNQKACEVFMANPLTR